MNTLVGSVVRLEPLAIHHIPDLFDALGNDEEAWQWMLAKTPTTLAEMGSTIYSRDTVYFSILQSEWPEVKVSLQKALA